MAIDLFYAGGSPPCRLVMLVAAALNLQLNLRELNLQAGDQYHPEFLKLNPQHTVPTIIDDGFVLWESRAISRYLVNKYGGEDNSLYPSDPQKRALVDMTLDFDIGTLYPRFSQYFYPQLFGGKADPALLTKLEEALDLLNTALTESKYVAGTELTIADLSIVASVSTFEAAGINLKPYSNVLKWFELIKSTAPDYEQANEKGINQFKEFVTVLQEKTKTESKRPEKEL